MAAATIAASLVLLPPTGPAAMAAGAGIAARADGVGGTAPVDVVILADESGSMRQFPNEITGEQQAATQIVQGEWSPQSQVAIFGFGGAPTAKDPPQSAIDQYCGLTPLSAAGAREKLAKCAGKITARTAAQGNNTDFAAALKQARDVLGAVPPGTLPLVFILTDGQLDVGAGSPYAPHGPAADGNAAAQGLLTAPGTGILARLRQARAEIWPVGFGAADTTELGLFARSGAQSACPAGSGGDPAPAIVGPGVSGAQEAEAIQAKLIGAFAEARCAVLGQSGVFVVPAGKAVSKTVTVSQLATFASLIVDKGDPRVTVTYTDPHGGKISDNSPAWQSPGSLDGAAYAPVGGISGGVPTPLEALRLDNPRPGPWTITFTSPSGVPAQEASLSVVWQGAVTLEFIKQAIGDPGHPYQLAVQPTVRSAPVPAGALRGLAVHFQVSWPGGQPLTIPGTLDRGGDAFTASLSVPANARGTARVVATAAEPGVQGEADTAFSVVLGGGLSVTLNLPRGKVVNPGRSLRGTATIATNGAPATSIVFSLAGLADGVDATLDHPSGIVAVKSGQQQIPVAVKFAADTRRGQALGTIRWAPAPAPGQSVPPADWLAFDSVNVDIEPAPTPLYEQPVPWGILGALIIAAGAFLAWRRREAMERRLFEGRRAARGSGSADKYKTLGTPAPRSPGTDRYARPGGLSAGSAEPPRTGSYQAPGQSPPTTSTRRQGTISRVLGGWKWPSR